MASKMGRPKAANPKNVSHTIRLDADTERRLKAYCERHGISRGEAIRQGIHLLLAQEKK